jgi:hypothetical protein
LAGVGVGVKSASIAVIIQAAQSWVECLFLGDESRPVHQSSAGHRFYAHHHDTCVRVGIAAVIALHIQRLGHQLVIGGHRVATVHRMKQRIAAQIGVTWSIRRPGVLAHDSRHRAQHHDLLPELLFIFPDCRLHRGVHAEGLVPDRFSKIEQDLDGFSLKVNAADFLDCPVDQKSGWAQRVDRIIGKLQRPIERPCQAVGRCYQVTSSLLGNIQRVPYGTKRSHRLRKLVGLHETLVSRDHKLSLTAFGRLAPPLLPQFARQPAQREARCLGRLLGVIAQSGPIVEIVRIPAEYSIGQIVNVLDAKVGEDVCHVSGRCCRPGYPTRPES